MCLQAFLWVMARLAFSPSISAERDADPKPRIAAQRTLKIPNIGESQLSQYSSSDTSHKLYAIVGITAVDSGGSAVNNGQQSGDWVERGRVEGGITEGGGKDKRVASATVGVTGQGYVEAGTPPSQRWCGERGDEATVAPTLGNHHSVRGMQDTKSTVGSLRWSSGVYNNALLARASMKRLRRQKFGVERSSQKDR